MALGLFGAALLLAIPASAATPAPLHVRASDAAGPCVAAAAAIYDKPIDLEVGALRDAIATDVFVAASAVEMTRAIESGRAVDGSEVAIASIPWVLSVPRGNPEGLAALEDLARPGLDAVMLSGPAAYQARKAVADVLHGKLRETTDVGTLRSARVALVPLSLAGGGDHVRVDLPALETRAAVAKGTRRADEAAAFVRFLGSEQGQRAFAGCAPPAP